MYNLLSAPITCQIELTTKCNNNCIYCYNHWRHEDRHTDLSVDMRTMDSIIDQLIQLNIFSVTFTGGECLFEKKVLFRALEKLIENGVDCTVNSNLTFIKKEDAETLHKIGLKSILTSICSHTPDVHDFISQRNGAFEQTIRGIKISLDAGLSIASSMVLLKSNVKDIVQTGVFLKDIGAYQFYATKASPPVNAKNFQEFMISRSELITALDDLNFLHSNHGIQVGILECYPLCLSGTPEKYPFILDRRCSAGITTCTIGASGDIRPCSHSDKVYGNVNNGGIQNAWKAMTEQRNGFLLPNTCKVCSIFQSCSGGCMVDAHYCSGLENGMDPYAESLLVSDIKPINREVVSIETSQKLKINPTLKNRREELGVLCADLLRINRPAILTDDTYDLVIGLVGKTFCATEVSDITGLTCDESSLLCGALVRDGIMVKI